MIAVLDNETIDKIAAGEVIERPMSVVKELVENSIDAKASSITVEIKSGGIDYIRITDNGCGINKEEVPTAFLRHATSKIKSVTDLLNVNSLGFRGEALSSIAAVSKVELLTKTNSAISGVRYVIEGAREMVLEDVGIPNGTNFIVRALFYNTPARRKFLKSPMTEASYITELMEHIMLSHPEISFKLIINGNTKLQTLGKGDLKTVIYEVYGRDMTESLIPVTLDTDNFSINGYVGKPEIARGNRNFEIYYVNGRYIRSSLVSRALDEAYKPYLMLHKFPVTFLCFDILNEQLDVNVHPTKMEIRFLEAERLYSMLVTGLQKSLKQKELIPSIVEDDKKEKSVIASPIPEPFEINRLKELGNSTIDEKSNTNNNPVISEKSSVNDNSTIVEKSNADKAPIINEKSSTDNISIIGEKSNTDYNPTRNEKLSIDNTPINNEKLNTDDSHEFVKKKNNINALDQSYSKAADYIKDARQMNLFEDKFLDQSNVIKHKIIGQIFNTYWLVEMDNKLFIIDQHAAHEKVMYERLIKEISENSINSQLLFPPVLISLSLSEEALLNKYIDNFEALGFEIEHFGGREYSIRAVPTELFGLTVDEYFHELLDELSDEHWRVRMESIDHRIATMACKSAVKGNNSMTYEEAVKLIDELMTLDNPYNCPHGRPVIISYSKYELEKKFKRIL